MPGNYTISNYEKQLTFYFRSAAQTVRGRVVKTVDAKENMERYKSQITLAQRRIRAFEIVNWFIENELNKKLVFV